MLLVGSGRYTVELVEVSTSWPGYHNHQKKKMFVTYSYLLGDLIVYYVWQALLSWHLNPVFCFYKAWVIGHNIYFDSVQEGSRLIFWTRYSFCLDFLNKCYSKIYRLTVTTLTGTSSTYIHPWFASAAHFHILFSRLPRYLQCHNNAARKIKGEIFSAFSVWQAQKFNQF